jgi:ABC-2 type transport system ATP-binding protein
VKTSVTQGEASTELAAIEVAGLGKRYRRRTALRDCTFTVPAGRVTALAGSNGAGKTTLLSILAGLLVPSEGQVLLGGRPVVGGDDGVAFVSQTKPLYRHFSVADMLRLGRNLNSRWDQERAERLLKRFDIGLDRLCGKLSGGQQAQVAFALALGTKPSVLLLDEPLANVDPPARRLLTEELLTEVAETGVTVLMSTHVLTELVGVADHLLVLADGNLVLAGETDELLAEHVRCTGPLGAPPPDGEVVQARQTEDQSVLLVRHTEGEPAAPWIARPVQLEDLVVAYLTAAKERSA